MNYSRMNSQASSRGAGVDGTGAGNAFRQYQSGVLNAQNKSAAAQNQSMKELVPARSYEGGGGEEYQVVDYKQDGSAHRYLPVVQNAPSGTEICANAVIKFSDFYARFAGVKIGTLIGLKASLLEKATSSDQIRESLNEKLRYFPRSYRSYCAQIKRLAKLGKQYPEAMTFTLIALLPPSTGLPKQLTGYDANMSASPWMQQLCSSVSFGRLASQVKVRLPQGCDSFMELLGFLVELAVADCMHAFLSSTGREGSDMNLSTESSHWIIQLCSYMICKHPAFCKPGDWYSVHKYPFSKAPSKVFAAVPSKSAVRHFTPVDVAFGVTRILNFEQWSSLLGLMSVHHLDVVTKHMLDLAEKTSRDPMSVVLLAGCRYIRWNLDHPSCVNSIRTFLRFIIAQLDGHRDMSERVMHISTIDSAVVRLDFTNVYARQDVLSLFQMEISQIYTMCVRWSKQDSLKDASYLLLANIFARCPSSFLMKSHNFIAKRLVGPFSSTEKSRRCIEAHVQMLRGFHCRTNTGWLPENTKFKHLSAQFLMWETDNGSVFHFVPRSDETRETRMGRVMQICEAVYFKSQLNGGLKLELELVHSLVALLLQCTASAFEYMVTIVLPAMLGIGAMHRKENDAKEWKLAALITLRVVFDPSSGFSRSMAESIAVDQDEQHNHVAFPEYLQDTLTNFRPTLKDMINENWKKIKAEELALFPNVAIAAGSDVDLLDDHIDFGPEIIAAASSVAICREDFQLREEYLRQLVESNILKPNEEEGVTIKASEPLRLANRIRLRTILTLQQEGLHKLYTPPGTKTRTTTSRLVAELNSIVTLLDPNFMCGLENGSENLLQKLLFVDNSILLKEASLSVQHIVETLPSRIPDLLGLICRKAFSVVFSSPYKILFALAHAGFLVESWLHHLSSSSSLPSVMLTESQQPLQMLEAWALTSLCHGHESIRTYAFWILTRTGKLAKVLENLKAAESGGSNPAGGNTFISISSHLKGDSLIDQAFFRASTDYAELEGMQLPSLKSDAGSILQPSIPSLVTSKHSGKCWPKLLRSVKGQEIQLNKSELYLNFMLEVADLLSAQKKFQPILSELWSMLKAGVWAMPSITNAIKGEGTGNTLVTTLSFFFAVATLAREEESSEYGMQHKVNYGERKNLNVSRPSSWNASIEANGSAKNLGSFPMEEEHIMLALEKWSQYCSTTDMKNAASRLKLGTLMEKDINFEQIRKWVENKRSRKYDKAQETEFAGDVKGTILSFLTKKVFFSNLTKDDQNIKEIVFKTMKSAHWSSMVVIVQCLISWYEETSASSKTDMLLELISYLLTSHNIHLSMQYSDKMLDCVLTAISALEQDLELLISGSEQMEAGKGTVSNNDLDETFDRLLKHHKLIEEHASLLCFLSSSFKKLYGKRDNLWPARRRKHSLMFLSRVSASIVDVLAREATSGHMESKQQEIEKLVNPVALALNEVVSVCSMDDIHKEMKFSKAFDKVNHHLSITLKLLLDSKQADFQLEGFIRSCLNSRNSGQQFNALYHYVLVSTSRLNGPIEFEDIDSHCVSHVIQNAPLLILACISEIFKDNPATFGNATRFLIVIAAVLHVTYTDNHDNLEFQATMAMLHGLHHSFVSTKDAYSIDVIKRIASICTKISVEVIAEACVLLRASLEKDEDTLWILKTLSYWCEPIDTLMLNGAKLNIRGASRESDGIDSKRITSSVILSELCSLTAAIYSKGGISSSIYLAGMVEVWESLCYSHGEFNNSSMIQITTFLMQNAITGIISRPLLRRILDTLCKSLQDQMISVLSDLLLKALDVTSEGGREMDQNTLSISGLSAMSLSNIFQGMTSFPSKINYATLFVCCLLTLDDRNTLLRSGMRSLLSSLMSQIKSRRDQEPLGDVILKLCNAANDTSSGKIFYWSGVTAGEYPGSHLKAVVRACTIYLSGISPSFDVDLVESAMGIAFKAKNMALSGQAFEVIACLDCYSKLRMQDICKCMPLMAKLIEENGNQMMGLNKESSSLLQIQENATSKSLYLGQQVCRFLHGLIQDSNKSEAGKSELIAYFWMTLAIMRCKIRPLYSHCLDLLSSLFSNKGDVFLSTVSKANRLQFWEYCEGWNPKMDGVGPLLLWGVMQDNYPLYTKSIQLFVHSSSLANDELFHRVQMHKGDLTGTKVFKTAMSIVWLNMVLVENEIPKYTAVNAHLDFETFVQMEFFKVKSMVASGLDSPREWEPFLDVLVLGARGNFTSEPHRFLTACVRNLSTGLAKRDLLELGEVLSVLVCKGSKHLRTSALKMVLLLISQPEKYYAGELLERFFPILDHDLEGEYESKEILERIRQIVTQSNTYRILQGGPGGQASGQPYVTQFGFYDKVISGGATQKIKAALSAITVTTAKLDDYIIKENTNENDWDSLLKTEPILSISEKLQRTSIKKGPTHKKTKVDEESLIESDFLNSFMEKVKPSAISGFVAEESKNKQERKASSRKGLGKFYLAVDTLQENGKIKVGSKVRRKKAPKALGQQPVSTNSTQKKRQVRGPPPPPPIEVLRATTTPAVTRSSKNLFSDDSYSDSSLYYSDDYSYYSSSTEEEYSDGEYSSSYYSESSPVLRTPPAPAPARERERYQYKNPTTTTDSGTDSDSYDYSSSYSTSTTAQMSYSSAD